MNLNSVCLVVLFSEHKCMHEFNSVCEVTAICALLTENLETCAASQSEEPTDELEY